ncbi:MAG: cryptochrome/photolyase family protein [Rickettsiales bacterium]|nr:cryptochrome/photolyase family protein [Rickettsiales bacterium]
MATLRLILGDQLSHNISSLSDCDKNEDVILLAEVKDEATYVKHHKKKIIFLFSAMRHFAQALKEKGYQVRYIQLNDQHNSHSLSGEVQRALNTQTFDKVIVTEPGEYRLWEAMQNWSDTLGVPVEIRDDDRFLCSRADFAQWMDGRKNVLMEHFYRSMRQRTGLLMQGDEPEGGTWNLDKENRKPYKGDVAIKGPMEFTPDAITTEVIELVERWFGEHFGESEPFWFAVTQTQAKRALSYFITHSLPHFGDYQDAMVAGEPYLFHSLLSPYINAGLLDPLDICKQVQEAYASGDVPLNAAEGFIRQIIGWREFIRGIYWHHMPDYVQKNHLLAQRKLPAFYWNGDTDMRCMREAIETTRREAYAHHIQRLMVTGNFALLAGLDVREVCEWYLLVYADAYEWVELPNTLGMALHGDGGVVGTKPYIASGSYINRMSNYCKDCRYNVKEKTGEGACPFNFLFWDFLIRHRERFANNRRMQMMYRNLDRMDEGLQKEIASQAKSFLEGLA